MADLSAIEKRLLEDALGMGTGYVLNFSNRTFSEFFWDEFGIDIYNEKYEYGSGSKANRMRAFWDQDENNLVGRLLMKLFEYWDLFKEPNSPDQPPETCIKIATRLIDSASVQNLDSLRPNTDDESFENLAKAVRDAIERNEPESGIDRLHTFTVKYFRALCEKRGIDTNRKKPLHGLVGEYLKALRTEGLIESEMTERIIKYGISIMESFNQVRNEQSYAHDNPVLNYEESLLIYNNITASIRFIESIETRSSK